jgi:hypothetical protein
VKDPDLDALNRKLNALLDQARVIDAELKRASSRAAVRKRWQRGTRELLEQLQAIVPLGEPPADEPLELVRWRALRQAIDAAWNALEECKERAGP